MHKTARIIIFWLLVIGLIVGTVGAAAGDTLLTVEEKGGVFNGGFEGGSGQSTSAGSPMWVGSETYGWYSDNTGVGAIIFDANTSHTGTKSMKLSTENSYLVSAPATAITKYGTRIYPSTTYRYSGWFNTTAGVTDVLARVITYDSSGTIIAGYPLIPFVGAGKTWTPGNVTFTSDSNAAYARISIVYTGTGFINVDDITLEQVTNDTYTGSSVRVYPVVQGVTSTDNIDQSFTTTPDSAGALGNNGGTQYYQAQTFTPTKSQLAQVKLWKGISTGTPTGDVKIYITTTSGGIPTTTILASTTIAAATWQGWSNGETPSISVPCIVTPGTQYAIVVQNTATESTNNYYTILNLAAGGYSGGSGLYNDGTWHSITNDYYFKMLYAKNTESVNVTVNGNTTMLDTGDATGLLPGATVDTYRGFYNWTNPNVAYSSQFTNMFHSTSSVGGRVSTPTVFLNGYRDAGLNGGIDSDFANVNRNVTIKINTMLQVNSASMSWTTYESAAGATFNLMQSSDGNTWYPVRTVGTSGTFKTFNDTISIASKNTTFYLRFGQSGGTGELVFKPLSINATLNTTTSNQTVLAWNNGQNLVNISSDGRAVSSSLDPSLMVNISFIEGGGGEAQIPLAMFTKNWGSSTVSVPQMIRFNDTSTNTPTSWVWNCGKGSDITTQNISCNFIQAGFQNVTLTVSNSAGSSTNYTRIRVLQD